MQLFIAIIILLLSLPVSDMEEMKRLYENEERGIILGASAKFEEAQRVLEVSHSFYYWRNINLHYLVANDAAMGKLETDLAQHFFEALSFSRDNQTEQALKTISVLIVNKPEYIPFYFYRAAWYQDCNNNTLAIQDYCKIIDLDSLSADAYLRRGQIYFNEKKYKSAIFDYRTYFSLQTIQPLAEDECIELKLDPKFKNNTYKIFLAKNYFLRENFLEAYNNVGVSFQINGNCEKAILYYTKAIEVDPDFSKTYVNRGMAYRDCEKNDSALIDFSKALEIDPEYSKVYYLRGCIYKKMERIPEALADLNKAVIKKPDYPKVYYAISEIFFSMGKYNQVLSAVNKVLYFEKDNYWAWYMRAYALDKLDSEENAIQAYKNFIKIAPDDQIKYIEAAYARIIILKRALKRKNEQ